MNKKKIAAAAQRCLRELHGDTLPVDVLKITRGLGVHVVDNTAARNVGEYLKGSELGKCMTDGKTWVVIFDDTQPLETKRFTVGHEIGHIYLDHAGEIARLKLDHERQADEFAAQLLCPGNELRRRRLTEAEEVARVCKVPIEAARASLRGMMP